jgi:nucleoside-diphosphate-sugar epimerase
MRAADGAATGGPQARTVAVLGGTGFLGSAISRYLAERGHEVVAVARRVPERDAPDHIRTLDLTEAAPPLIADLLQEERVDGIVNAAGGMWGLTDEQMVTANTTLVERLIDAVGRLEHRPRLVQIGSVHEYGVVPIGTDIGEDTPPRPVMRYGELKLRCTEAVTAATGDGRIEGVTLRIGNVVGNGQPRVSLLGRAADQLAAADREGARARLELGSLGAQRDFVGLSDAVRAVDIALAAPEVGVPVVNIGRGVAATAREMVCTLIEVSGVPAELAEAPEDEPERTWQRLRVDLAAEVLGWAPEADLHEDLLGVWETAEADVRRGR